MAAQAVDFTISGQVNRALFITDTDGGTSAEVKNNGGSSTRVRANGSSELEGGGTVGIQFEYEESGTGVNLRHANLQYGGDFGKVTIGQGSEAGDGSQYSDTTGVNGIGHGAGTSTDFSLGDYFGSLDGGGRVNMIRYDTPSIGPISAAVSVANGDRVSAKLGLSTEVAGSSFGAQLAALQVGGGSSSIGASFGSTLASGLTISGAWAKGSDMTARRIPRRGMLIEAVPAHFRSVDIVDATFELDSNEDTAGVETATFDIHMTSLRERITAGAADGADVDTVKDGELAKMLKRDLFTMAGAGPRTKAVIWPMIPNRRSAVRRPRTPRCAVTACTPPPRERMTGWLR